MWAVKPDEDYAARVIVDRKVIATTPGRKRAAGMLLVMYTLQVPRDLFCSRCVGAQKTASLSFVSLAGWRHKEIEGGYLWSPEHETIL